jgi:hypothetical protein
VVGLDSKSRDEVISVAFDLVVSEPEPELFGEAVRGIGPGLRFED